MIHNNTVFLSVIALYATDYGLFSRLRNIVETAREANNQNYTDLRYPIKNVWKLMLVVGFGFSISFGEYFSPPNRYIFYTTAVLLATAMLGQTYHYARKK